MIEIVLSCLLFLYSWKFEIPNHGSTVYVCPTTHQKHKKLLWQLAIIEHVQNTKQNADFKSKRDNDTNTHFRPA